MAAARQVQLGGERPHVAADRSAGERRQIRHQVGQLFVTYSTFGYSGFDLFFKLTARAQRWMQNKFGNYHVFFYFCAALCAIVFKVRKSAYATLTKIFHEHCIWLSKNSEFDAYF
jgi:hypothetical protein